MSTAIIIAIVVVVIVVIALVALRPMIRRKREERELGRRRDQAVEHHRGAAEDRRIKADMAEQRAQRDRAEAELQEKRAEMHERGLADDQLRDDDGERGDREREGSSGRH